MNKTLIIVGIIATVLTTAAWSYAHGPGYGYGPGPGFYRMGPGMYGPGMHGPGMHGPGMYGPGMRGPWHMGMAWGPGHGPCWQPTELTPEQTEQYEDNAKAAVEQYIQRFLPGYKLEKKAETENAD